MMARKLTLEELPPVMLAFSGILGIGPMVIYRLFEGSYAIAAVNAVAVIAFAIIAWSIYVKRAVRVASVCMALVAISAAVTTISIRGGDQIIWMYPATIALFYLLKPKEAAIASLIAIAIITPIILEGRDSERIAIYLASLAVTISLSVAFAVVTAAQRKDLHATTLRDPLTGVGNRRALDTMLDAAVTQSRANSTSFVLIMLDIDHFKTVNDKHGHAIGDLVLCNIAKAVLANIRPTDACFRAGGEEFVVLAPATELQHAHRLAERLRIAIHKMSHAAPGISKALRVTASFGLAEYREGETRDSLYKRADDALYEAKRSGRNRLHASDGTVSLSGTASYPALIEDTTTDTCAEHG